MQSEETIYDKKKTGRTTFWTSTRKSQLKRLTNKVRGSEFGHLYKRMLSSFHP